MANGNRREHERIDIELPTRLWIDENLNGRPIEFEGFAKTHNLSIGGTFVESNYLLPVGFPVNLDMRMADGDHLETRGQVVHAVDGDPEQPRGMGFIFTEVDAENREKLLRFFVSERIKEFFYDKFIVEFPHLEEILTLRDIALVINLWEDKDGRLTALRHPDATRQPRRGRHVLPDKRGR